MLKKLSTISVIFILVGLLFSALVLESTASSSYSANISDSPLLLSSQQQEITSSSDDQAKLEQLKIANKILKTRLKKKRITYRRKVTSLNKKISRVKSKLRKIKIHSKKVLYKQKIRKYRIIRRKIYKKYRKIRKYRIIRRKIYKKYRKDRARYLRKISTNNKEILKLRIKLTHKPVGVFMDNPYTDIPNFESKVNHRVEFFLWYQSIIEDFDTDLANWLWQRGTKLELAFEPRIPSESSTYQPDYQLKDITAGQHDDDLYRWAYQLKSFGHPVYFRPMSEMNGNWTTWAGSANGNSPSDYAPAWRHIFDIFENVGATNVIWVWAPNRDGDTSTAYETYRTYYPGSDYVDYIGLNGYNWGTMYKTPTWTSSWQSFSEVFGPSYKIYTTYTAKPLMISEMASTEVGGSKASWIADAFTKIKTQYPRIEIVVWFNVDKETDWRIHNSDANTQAFIDYAL